MAQLWCNACWAWIDFAHPTSYAFLELFVYAPHALLPEYDIRGRNVAARVCYYMINFRRIYRVECDQVVNPKQVPLAAKRLQLSVEARCELRNKMAYYFGRPAEEDQV